ncbi:MAG: glycosyltransferase family 1 protein [Candidatus Kerfeldbacteria bacterium]
MVIGIDASRANKQERTGTEWYSYHVIQQLKEIIPDTHQVFLYTKEPLLDDLADLPQHWKSKVLAWPPRFLWTQLRLSLEMLLHKPDILYIPAHTIPIIHPEKIALVVHDVGFERQDELYDPKLIGYNSGVMKRIINAGVKLATLGKYGSSERDYHRFAMDLAVKHATRIITVSEFSKREMIDIYKLPEELIAAIPNGFNALAAPADTEEILAELSISKPYIAFVGRLEQKKNVPRLIEAFGVLKQSYGYEGKLVLVGSPGYQHELIQKLIRDNQLSGDIIETGWADSAQLAAIVANADVFVLPSLYEGFGIPVLEAMSADTVVACSDIPSLREVAGDAAFFFNSKSSNAIAAALNTVISDELLRDDLILRGRRRITHFSWALTAKSTWAELEKILYNTGHE